ncbi:MAG: hypothetical protein ABIJ09_02070 [Pseudomonadota bacterium]
MNSRAVCILWLSSLLGACPDNEVLLGGKDSTVLVVDASADASSPADVGSVDNGPLVDAAVPDSAQLDVARPDATAPDEGRSDSGAADQGQTQDAAQGPDAASAADAALGPVTGCVEGHFVPYWGNIHAHTSASDGEGSYAEAFAYARDQGGLDFFMPTDHVEQLYRLTGDPSGEYDECRSEADAVTVNGSYLAMCGYEYGAALSIIGPAGHSNVFLNDDLFPAIQLRLSDYYDSVKACATCVTQFNHPRDATSQSFNNFAYDAAVDEKMNLLEFNTGADAWAVLNEALEEGWHVAPTWNQDNHSANWGTANAHRTGLYLAALTRDELAQALRQRRSFASGDANASIALRADTCWMGSIVAGVSEVQLHAEAADADDGFDRIELYGPMQALLATFACGGQLSCSGDFDLPVSQPVYMIARAIELDGDVLTSAPIWLAP